MALDFHIEISDDDLPFFMQALQRAEQRAAGKSLPDSQGQNMPEFVRSRLASVENLIQMVRDEGWGLADEDRSRVISALTYFADPEDLIPDDVPVLGFLDDAIMIEVVQRVLAPEIEAYGDFCAYRSQEAARRGEDTSRMARAEWLEGRRAELQARMRSRRGSYAPGSAFEPRFRFT